MHSWCVVVENSSSDLELGIDDLENGSNYMVTFSVLWGTCSTV